MKEKKSNIGLIINGETVIGIEIRSTRGLICRIERFLIQNLVIRGTTGRRSMTSGCMIREITRRERVEILVLIEIKFKSSRRSKGTEIESIRENDDL